MDLYFRISNADGKAWVLPAHNMRTALCLYQPGGVKGKLLKALLPLLWRFPLVRKFLRAEQTGRPWPSIAPAVREAFGVDEYECAAFEGTPCVHQKVTVQIFQGRRILGYVKISSSSDVILLFRHEKRILDSLRELGVGEVPRAFNVVSDANQALFIQTTTKTPGSRTPHDWNGLMEAFLVRLERATGVQAEFGQTEMAGDIKCIRPWLPERIKPVFEKALSHFEGNVLDCCLTHNDFTPWNMYVQDGRLYVFDWEYASFCNPVGMDRCHFLVQSAFFEKKWTPAQVYEHIIAPDGRHRDEYTLYLLSIIARYLRRDPSCTDSEEIARWGQLLEMLESHRRDTEK